MNPCRVKRCSQRCSLGFRSSEICRCIMGWSDPDSATQRSASVFRNEYVLLELTLVDEVRSFEVSVSNYPLPQHHISEERNTLNNFCLFVSLLSGIFQPSINCYMRHLFLRPRNKKIKNKVHRSISNVYCFCRWNSLIGFQMSCCGNKINLLIMYIRTYTS